MPTITLPAQLTSLPHGLALVTAYATAEGLPPQRVLEIELAVEEALANVCLHAYQDGTGEVEVRCVRINQDHIGIEIIDTGMPFDLTASPPPDLTADPAQRQVGGLGLVLIRALMDGVAYHREGAQNILSLTVQLQP